MKEWVRAVLAIRTFGRHVCTEFMHFPIYATKTAWIYIIAYSFSIGYANVTLMQPKLYDNLYAIGHDHRCGCWCPRRTSDYAVNAFNGFNVGGSYLFPTLFVTIACGAVSGFHNLVSSGTSSKTISNEKDMPMVGYGAMVVESLLVIVALVVVRCRCRQWYKAGGTPFSTSFSTGVAGSWKNWDCR